MKQQEVFKKIGHIIKEINEQYEYRKAARDQLNDLELELFVANAHFLADHSEVLRKLSRQNAQPTPPPPPAPVPAPPPIPEKPKEEKYFEPVVQLAKSDAETEEEEKTISEQPENPTEPVETVNMTDDQPVPEINLGIQGTEDEFSVMMPEPEIIKHELVLDESQNWEDEDDTGFEINEPAEPAHAHVPPPPPKVHVHPEPEPQPEPEPEVKREPEKQEKEQKHEKEEKKAAEHKEEKEQKTEEPLTIHQKMTAQLQAAGKTAEQPHVQTIADLKQGINLNDKLLYIKDLFNGYNLAYSEAIDILNRFTSFEEADKFLQSNYAVKNHWEDKQATADKFYALLKRRYL